LDFASSEERGGGKKQKKTNDEKGSVPGRRRRRRRTERVEAVRAAKTFKFPLSRYEKDHERVGVSTKNFENKNSKFQKTNNK
jgi:hypothetical protein